MRPRPTASSLERGAMCPASFALPQIRESSIASETGNDNHARLEKQAREYQATGNLPDGELGEILRGQQVVCVEGAFAVSLHSGTSRLIGESINRNYGQLATNEMATTLDLILRHRETGAITVIDWKSRERVTRAERNWQIKLQVIAAMAYTDAISIKAGLVYLDDWHQDLATFDSFDVPDLCGQIDFACAMIEAAKPTDPVHMGPWCKYCPAQHSCPARTAIVRSAFPGEDALAHLTDKEAGEVWEKLQIAGKQLEAIEKVLRERAKVSPLPLPNGKRLALIECSKSSVDMAKVEKLLAAAGHEVPRKTATYDRIQEIRGENHG